MKTIGYIRVSTDKQDADSQRYRLLTYAQAKQVSIREFVEVEISLRKNQKERRIEELKAMLERGDTLLVTELSRLGRNMLETLTIIHALTEAGVKLVFVNQPELSTVGPQTNLLLAIYSYFAEAEREFISIRTKQGLVAAKALGVTLGRPKGRKNKVRRLDPYREQIAKYLKMGLNLAAILIVINVQLEQPITYPALRYYVEHEEELSQWRKPKKPRGVKL